MGCFFSLCHLYYLSLTTLAKGSIYKAIEEATDHSQRKEALLFHSTITLTSTTLTTV